MEDQVPDDLPPNEYYEYFKPDYRLHLQVSVSEGLVLYEWCWCCWCC